MTKITKVKQAEKDDRVKNYGQIVRDNSEKFGYEIVIDSEEWLRITGHGMVVDIHPKKGKFRRRYGVDTGKVENLTSFLKETFENADKNRPNMPDTAEVSPKRPRKRARKMNFE